MNSILVVESLFVFLFVLVKSEDCLNKGISIVSPEVAVPGKKTAVFINWQQRRQKPQNVTLHLTQDGRRFVEVTKTISDGGIFDFDIPKELSGSYVLQTNFNSSKGENDSISSSKCSILSICALKVVSATRTVIIRTSKRIYKPGETVDFWIMALDHDLQIASDLEGEINVKDPAGSKVILWDQVQLDDGVKSFRFPLSEYAISGKWETSVVIPNMEFFAVFEVNQELKNGMSDNVAAAEEHYVELKFGKEMHRRYKPGLPFVGKVAVMSTEKTVRVRVKVYDNTTSIYSQDIEISGGEGSVVVPSIMADSQTLTLQAELVSVEGKEIESHYVLAREAIYKWNSTSDCYLLIEGYENVLQAETETKMTVLSTCSCPRHRIHYVITTEGGITGYDDGENFEPNFPTQIRDNATCLFEFSFKVKSVMAPISQLLVYYFTPEGEPVSDFVTFNVKLISDKILVNVEEKDFWLPEQDVDVDVSLDHSSLVCILGGRSGSGNEIKFNPYKSEEIERKTNPKKMDFFDVRLKFSEKLNCEQKSKCVEFFNEENYNKQRRQQQFVDSLIGGYKMDELYIWKCFNYTKDKIIPDLGLKTPSETGKWSIWAIAVTEEGLRFSSPVPLTVFRPLDADFHLPSDLRVGEVAEVDIKIVNNINSCMDVTALLALSEGSRFMSNGLLYVTERLRLGPQGATSLVVKILVTQTGLRNLTVEVNGYSSPSCEGLDTKSSNSSSLVGAIIRSGSIRVHPEGMSKTKSENSYFCANENLIISTSDSNKYEWIPAIRNKAGLIIEAKVTTPNKIGPFYLIFAESRSSSKEGTYRIIVGDKNNEITWLTRGKYDHGIHLKTISTPGILSSDDWRRFWLTWDENFIKFGKGSMLNNQTLLSWKVSKKFKIQEIGFASSWGSTLELRIWNFNDESGFSQVLHLDVPKSVVPGSASGTLLVTSGLAIPTSPTVDVLHGGLFRTLSSISNIINSRKLNNSSITTVSDDILLKHMQKVMTFRKLENSFSEHPMVESHLSTLYTLEVLSKIEGYVNVESELLENIKRWLQMRQEDDGSFTPLPADLKYTPISLNNRTNQISFDEIVEMTAETVIGFYEIGIEDEYDVDTIQKAKIFLENSLPNVKSSETLAALTLALVLLKSATSSWAIEKLRNVSTTEDGEFGWPRTSPQTDPADSLYETENEQNNQLSQTSILEEYKGSLYALSVFSIIGDLKMAESTTRYLFYRSYVLESHPELIHRTIESLSLYNSLVENHHQSLTVSLATSGMELTDNLQFNDTNGLSIEKLHLPSLPTKVFVYATGAGCGTVQGKIRYSTYESRHNTTLFDLSSQVIQEILPGKNSVEEIEGKLPMLKIKTCFRWKGSRPSGVIRLEISLFSGYELTCPNQISIEPQKYVSSTEFGHNSNKVWFVIGNVTDDCSLCFQFISSSNSVISSLRPAYAIVYPPSREDLAAFVFFHATRASSLYRGTTNDDFVTWFGKNFVKYNETDMTIENTVTCMKDCNSCRTKIDNRNETDFSKNVVKKPINLLTEYMEIGSENVSCTDIKLQQENETKKLLNNVTEFENSTFRSYTPKHVNTKLSDDSLHFFQQIDEERSEENVADFDPDVKNDKYILLDKKELWGLLKEAVDNQIEEKLKKKEIEITKSANSF